MSHVKKELVQMFNRALEMEHAARIQYLAHAEMVTGIYAETVISRLKELAEDEKKHEDAFRTVIGGYLGGEPTMSLAPTYTEQDTEAILKVNLNGEMDAVRYYKEIYRMVIDSKDELEFEFETLEHELRHIIIDEQEHIAELNLLLGN